MAASKRIFVSYTSSDFEKADAIRESLEAVGISCWIAPRDLEAGNQWSGSIVQAIQACEGVVVVFSEQANQSPQVAREMELAVSNRKTLITIRIADAMPTDDMQYFLGVSHWFNAFPKPLEDYLPAIVVTVQNRLKHGNNPWANAMRRMPTTRNGQVLLIIGAVVVVAIVAILFLKPPSMASLAKMSENPLTGRWEAKIKDATGKASDCILDVGAGYGAATFSDACPEWLSGSSGIMGAQKGMGVMAPDVYKSSDTGSFFYNNQAGGMFAGAFKFGLFGGMTTRDNHFGVIKWKKIAGDKPLPKATAGIVPDKAQWPLSDVSGMIVKANKFMRSKWEPDAVLMRLDLQPQTGGVTPSMTYYSPGTRHSRQFYPANTTGALSAPKLENMDTREAIPDHVLDLPAAIARAGMQPGDVQEAYLDWTNGGCGTGNFAIDNAILPRCPPGNFEGIQWQLRYDTGSRHVPATQ